SSGRGPTRLISPRSTFQSCGSSSSCDRASMRPTRVNRSSSVAVSPGPRAPSYILRNFSMPNGRPPEPMRGQRKKTGPRLSSLTATATMTATGSEMTARTTASVTSSSRVAATSAGPARRSLGLLVILLLTGWGRSPVAVGAGERVGGARRLPSLSNLPPTLRTPRPRLKTSRAEPLKRLGHTGLPHAVARRVEPADGAAIRPRVVGAAIGVERLTRDRSRLDPVEHLEHELGGNGLRPPQQGVERLAGGDLEGPLPAEVAPVDRVIDEEHRNAGARLAVRQHPEAREHAAVLGQHGAVDVQAASRRQLDQWPAEDLWAADGDDDLGTEPPEVVEHGRVVHVVDGEAGDTVPFAGGPDRSSARLRSQRPGRQPVRRSEAERALIAQGRGDRRLVAVERGDDEHGRGVRPRGQDAVEERR